MALGRQALQLLRDIKGSLDNGRRAPFVDFEEAADRKRARPWYVKRPTTPEELNAEGDNGPLPGIPARFMPFFEKALLASLQGMAADIEDDGRFVPIEHAQHAYYLAEAAVGMLRQAEQEHADMHAREAERARQAREQAEADASARAAEESRAQTPAEVKKGLRRVPRAKPLPRAGRERRRRRS